MSTQPKVLFVVTSHGEMGDTGKPTGWYLPEFAHPYAVLSSKCDITVASPKGGVAPLDPSSVEAFKDDATSTEFLKNSEALWKNTHVLGEFLGKAKDFDAIFYVGGHGPMFDLATDSTSHKVINEFYEAGKIVSAVCHGPAAFAYVKVSGGGYLLSGKKVTGFSNTEEDAVALTSVMPFKLEDALNEASGGKFVKAEKDWGEKVVVENGGKLITGQNPASATGVGKAIHDAIFA